MRSRYPVDRVVLNAFAQTIRKAPDSAIDIVFREADPLYDWISTGRLCQTANERAFHRNPYKIDAGTAWN
jgi:hypothetical protein